MSAGAWSRPVFNLNLAAWRSIRVRNRMPIGRGLGLRFCLAGGMLSALELLQRRLYRPVLERLQLEPPLFVIGHWRSGTTLLHELLALDDRFAAPTTHACFNPQRFLLTRHHSPAANARARPTGDVVVSPDSPQEEEFALLCMGATSPYEAFMFPQAIDRFEVLCDPHRFERAPALAWNEALTWILKATAYAGGAHRRLVVKSPAHSFRVARLQALFPGAAFVRLVREPCAVFASSFAMWQRMWQRYALAPPLTPQALRERILEIGLALERALRDSLRVLPTGRVFIVRYEDLVADPCGTVELLYERLALGDPASLLPGVRAYFARNPRRAIDPPEDWRALVRSRWPEMFDEFGYARN